MPKAPGYMVGGQPSKSRTFTNADLRQPTGPTTIVKNIYKSPEEQAQAGGGDPLAAAKAFLARPSAVQPPTVQDQAEADRRIAANAARISGAPTRLPGLRESLEGLASIGHGAQAASIVPSPASAPLLVGGTLLTVPEMLNRAFTNPAEGPGVVEGVGSILGLLPGLGGLSQELKAGAQAIPGKFRQFAGRAATGAEEMAGARVARQYGPSRYEQLIPNATAETPVVEGAGAVKGAGFTMRPSPLRPSVQAMESLAGKTAARPRSWMDDVIASGRTNIVPQPESGETAWTALQKLATRNEGAGMTGSQAHRSVEDLVYRGAGPEVDLSNELSALDKAAQQARAQHRFGRIYRSE